MAHLSYYLMVFPNNKCRQEEMIDYLQYGTLEEALNFLDECSEEYKGHYVSWCTIKDGQMIDKEIIQVRNNITY